MNQRDRHPGMRPQAQTQTLRPDPLRERFRDAVLARLRPLLSDLLLSMDADLRRAADAEERPGQAADDLTNLGILRRHAMLHEERWKSELTKVFAVWPQAPAAETSRYALISEQELQSQLVGQPVIEALERRFADILDVIDSRLWDFAVRVSGSGEALSPVAPRVFVEALLTTFPAIECSVTLRQALLRQFQAWAGERMGDFYAWFNTELAEAGFAMSRPGRYAVQTTLGMDGPAGAAFDPRGQVERASKVVRGASGVAGEMSEALRQRVRAQRARAAALQPPVTGRALGDLEFLAVLSLVQADPQAMSPFEATTALDERLRRCLVAGAAKLGLDPSATAMSLEQDDAIDLVGTLFDALLTAHAFDAQARQSMSQLAFPYVQLVLSEPGLFDDAADPAMRLLAELALLWDGATPESELHAAADAACSSIVDGYHGQAQVFEQVLETLRARVEPLRLRADVAARRVWQAVAGRERLEVGRRTADRALKELLGDWPLLPSVAAFLADVWRQALLRAWLREGTDSARYRDAAAIGQAVMQVDRDAADGAGHAVAGRLLRLETPLRECYVACGLDENAANDLIAALVSELARPDALRRRPVFEPLSSHAPDAHEPAAPEPPRLEIGGAFIHRATPDAGAAVRLIGVSELSGRHLFVGPSGQLMLESDEVDQCLRDGRLLARPSLDPVTAVIKRLTAPGALPHA